MIRPLFLAAAALVALTPAVAQTGYGRPNPQQYRAEQRTTAMLNDAVDEGYEAALDVREQNDRGGGYERPDAALMRAWHAHAVACRRGDTLACRRTGARAAALDGSGYAANAYDAPAYRYRGAGRYADPRDAYEERDGRRADAPPSSRYDNRYTRDDAEDDRDSNSGDW